MGSFSAGMKVRGKTPTTTIIITTVIIMEKLKYELEEEKAQKSFYQAKHKEVSTELQTKTSQLEESKKRIIALENESLAKQAEVKKVKRELEEKDNDIHGLSYDKDGLRQELKELNTLMETLKAKKGTLESLVQSKE